MKAEIVVTYEGITDSELKDAMQGLRNVEQENPARIMMFMLVNVPDLPTGKVTQMLKEINPPLEYIKVISKSSSLASNRVIQEEPK